ncbi:unnamed protein product [Clavelina lepadiformis]|uniref:Uncharacterized protein n=1 Tax=Clavelina lepadiformis TaxID=159417 RepID=A0ABP0GFF3_CLALP
MSRPKVGWTRWTKCWGAQPRVLEKGPTERVSERSCETAMYAFRESSLCQPDGDEKPFPSRCSGNGSRTHTATPPEGELTPATNSKEPHGSNGATPIVGNCYVADTRNENDERPGKAAWFAFSLFATNTE